MRVLIACLFTALPSLASPLSAATLSLADFRYVNREARAAAKDDYRSCAMKLDGKKKMTLRGRWRLWSARKGAARYLSRYQKAADPVAFARATMKESRAIATRHDDIYNDHDIPLDQRLEITRSAVPVKLIRNYEGYHADDGELVALRDELRAWEKLLNSEDTYDDDLAGQFWYDTSVLQQAAALANWRGSKFKFPENFSETIHAIHYRSHPE